MTTETDAKVLSMEEILAAEPELARYKDIPVPELKASIRIGLISAGDYIEWEQANTGIAGRTAGLRLLLRSIVNPDGSRAANNQNIEALVKQWNKMPVGVVSKLVREVMRFNEMLKPEFDKSKNVSGEAPSGVSPSDSDSPTDAGM
jgi:hypothetical protein